MLMSHDGARAENLPPGPTMVPLGSCSVSVTLVTPAALVSSATYRLPAAGGARAFCCNLECVDQGSRRCVRKLAGVGGCAASRKL
jgi:hypothetical protein